jgi:PAS domain-containing protein
MAPAMDPAAVLKLLHGSTLARALHHRADKTYVDVNAAYVTLLGWPLDLLVGRTAEALGIIQPGAATLVRSRLEGTAPEDLDTSMLVKTRAGAFLRVKLTVELVELRGEPHILTTVVELQSPP